MSTGNACFTLEPLGFSPKNYPGLIAWYDIDSVIFADATGIGGLRDKSSNNNRVIASNGFTKINPEDPTGIRYSDNLHINTTPLEFASEPIGLTVFLVATNNIDNTDNREKYQNYLTIFEDENNNPIKIGIDNFYDTIYIKSDSYQDGVIVGNIIPNTRNIINAICFNPNNKIFSGATYQNGRLIYHIESTSLTINKNINSFNITIGDDGTNSEQPHNPLNNIIYEIIIYNRALSENDISSINRYLGEKYKIPLNNSGNFNYKE